MEHEHLFVDAFIRPEKRDRYKTLMANPKRRREFLGRLAHSYDFITEHCIEIASADQTTSRIIALLKQYGAGNNCYVISESAKIDAQEMTLDDAIGSILGFGQATCLSCVAGKLGYYEGEDMEERMILFNRGKK